MKPTAFFMRHREKKTEQIYETKSTKNMYFAEKRVQSLFLTRRLENLILKHKFLRTSISLSTTGDK